MAITAAQFERALYPALRVVIKDQEEALAPEYKSLFNVLSTSKAYEEEWSYGGFGAPSLKQEGRPVQYGDMVTGYYKKYNQATYGLAYRVTLEMRQFEKYGVIREAAADLGDANREGIEVLCSGLLNTGLTATGPDSSYLFATNHPLLRGGTQSNRLSTLADLDVVSYQQLCTIFETMTSAEGRKRRMTPSMLWYSPLLEYKVKTILESTDD
ncbi:Mu-like prophage major head subunit gpT family protein, partial [Patescibacteria group bacterium]|nr:Mu-like prophage major head subunit gpT family protein [Patescibacteria group bacterium]